MYVDEIEVGPYVDIDNIYVMFNVSHYEQMIDKRRYDDALEVLNKKNSKPVGETEKT